MAPLHLALRDLDTSNSRPLAYWRAVSYKGAMLWHILPLNIKSKPYMWRSMAPSHLTLSMLSDIERSKSTSLIFWVVGDLYGIHILAGSLLPPLSRCHKRLTLNHWMSYTSDLYPNIAWKLTEHSDFYSTSRDSILCKSSRTIAPLDVPQFSIADLLRKWNKNAICFITGSFVF